jgi:hypothetical protein
VHEEASLLLVGTKGGRLLRCQVSSCLMLAHHLGGVLYYCTAVASNIQSQAWHEKEPFVTCCTLCRAACTTADPLQVNDMNDASIRDFAARLDAAAAAPPGSSSKVELRSAVKDREYEALSATVNGLCACPHHVGFRTNGWQSFGSVQLHRCILWQNPVLFVAVS